MTIRLPDKVDKIIKALCGAGYEAYAVGGCTRDSIMGLEPEDWDVTTSALPQQVKEVFGGYRVVETGIKHGTVTVIADGMPIEITTYRIDGEYADNRHPSEVRFTRTLREDLSRRDFTMNAICFNPESGITDEFGGISDIQKKCVRCIGEPSERFNEDALRILRALRFASVLGFKIEKRTAEAIHLCRQLLKNIAAERISAEFNKLIIGDGAGEVLLEYRDVFAVFIPEIEPMFDFDQRNYHHYLDVWRHTVKVIENSEANKVSRLAALFHDIGKPAVFTLDENGVGHFKGHAKQSELTARNVLNRLRCDGATISEVCSLVLHHDDDITPSRPLLKRWLGRYGETGLRRLIDLKRADNLAQSEEWRDRLTTLAECEKIIDEIIAEGECFSLKSLAVNGRDLMALGIPAGAHIGEILNELLSAVLDGKLENEKDALLKYAEELNRQD